MQTDSNGAINGTKEEIHQILVEETERHKDHAHKCLDLAYELVLLVHSLPALPPEDALDKGVDPELVIMAAISDKAFHDSALVNEWFDKQCITMLGEPASPESRGHLHDHIANELGKRDGAHSVCAVWHLGHVLEHLLWRDMQ